MFDMIHDGGGSRGCYEDGQVDDSESTQSGTYTQSNTNTQQGTYTQSYGSTSFNIFYSILLLVFIFSILLLLFFTENFYT